MECAAVAERAERWTHGCEHRRMQTLITKPRPVDGVMVSDVLRIHIQPVLDSIATCEVFSGRFLWGFTDSAWAPDIVVADGGSARLVDGIILDGGCSAPPQHG